MLRTVLLFIIGFILGSLGTEWCIKRQRKKKEKKEDQRIIGL